MSSCIPGPVSSLSAESYDRALTDLSLSPFQCSLNLVLLFEQQPNHTLWSTISAVELRVEWLRWKLVAIYMIESIKPQ